MVLPDGKPASLIGMYACTNHTYDGTPEGYEVAIWTAHKAGRNLGEKAFMFATYTFMEQSRQANVPPRLDMVTLRTMRINWKVIHIVLKLADYFGNVVEGAATSRTSRIFVDVNDMDFFVKVQKKDVERLAQEIYDQMRSFGVGERSGKLLCGAAVAPTPSQPCAVGEDVVSAVSSPPSRVESAATDSSSPKGKAARRKEFHMRDDVDVVEVARRFFPNSSVVDWLSTFEPLRKAVQRYAHDHPDDPEGDVTDSNGATYHIRRAFTVPQDPVGTKYVAVNVYSAEQCAVVPDGVMKLPHPLRLFVHRERRAVPDASSVSTLSSHSSFDVLPERELPVDGQFRIEIDGHRFVRNPYARIAILPMNR